jgi:type II secretory pathway component GspD/PulD (secretin)
MPKLLPALLLAAAFCHAQEFSLQGGSGKVTGPYALREGTEIVIGTNRAFLTQVRTQKHPLLDDLREIVIPEIAFKQASLRDAVTFLQQAAARADPKKRNLPLALGCTPEQEKALAAVPITCHARGLSLLDALLVITELTKTKYGVNRDIVTILPLDAPEGELFRRNYTVMPGTLEKITEGLEDYRPSERIREGLEDHSSSSEEPAKREESLKKRLADLGVSWPAGSSVAYHAILGKLVACNTRANLDLLGRLLEQLGGVPRQIRIDVQFVSFDLAQINRLATSGEGIGTATLTALWTNGFGELLAAPTVTTKAGQEAVVKGVTEVIYPTQFTCLGIGQTNSSGASCMVEPGGFQTRQTGTLLQVVPEVSEDGTTIHLSFNPNLTEYPDWRDFGQLGPNPMPMKQPLFYVRQTSTSVSVEHGRRVLIGGGLPTRDNKRAVYVFATATLEDQKGVPFQLRSADAEMPGQGYDTGLAPRFSLRDGKGNVTGPFLLCHGVQLRIGTRQAMITQVRLEGQDLPAAMREIVLPEVNFHGAALCDVAAFLRQEAQAKDPARRDFSIIPVLPSQNENTNRVTFTARNISLHDALKIVTEMSGAKCRVRGDVVMLVPRDAPEGEFFVRSYNVMAGALDRATSIARDLANGRGETPASDNDAIRKIFADLGVAWPVGSSVTYLREFHKLFIRNTRQNLHVLDLVLEEMNCTQRQIQIDAQFVSFDRTNIARIAAAGTGFDTAALTALWVRGDGQLLTAPTVVTKAGQEAIAMGGMEVTYPTQFTCCGVPPPDLTNRSAGAATGCVEPGSFQTRETGMILQVVPEVSAEGRMINLTLNPQIVEEPTWEDFGPVTQDAAGKVYPSQMKQPFFHVYSTSTSVSLASGKRVLVGGGMPSRDGKRLVYLFITATLVDLRGDALKLCDDDAPLLMEE